MNVLRSLIFLGLIAVGNSIPGQVNAEPVDQWLDYPPAFRSLFGNPEVIIAPVLFRDDGVAISKMGDYSPRHGFTDTPENNVVRVRSNSGDSREAIRDRLARGLAGRFYSRVLDPAIRGFNERKLNMVEFVEMDGGQFVEFAGMRLVGKKASEPIRDIWWNVRMGNDLTPASDHHLVAINLHYDHKDEQTDTVGHFCFALRERGGAADGDVLFDFRAPWYEDREPRTTEAVNIHNRLKLSGTTENLYDWIYTQTEYRHCYVRLWFLPVAKEQMALLNHFAGTGLPHAAGNFRAFRKNCASLGLKFYDRIQPLTHPAPHGGRFADMPVLAATRVVERFAEVPLIEIPNVTDKRGREPTAKSKVFLSKPTRKLSPSFQIIASDRRVN